MRPPRIELSAAPEATPAIQAIGVGASVERIGKSGTILQTEKKLRAEHSEARFVEKILEPCLDVGLLGHLGVCKHSSAAALPRFGEPRSSLLKDFPRLFQLLLYFVHHPDRFLRWGGSR